MQKAKKIGQISVTGLHLVIIKKLTFGDSPRVLAASHTSSLGLDDGIGADDSEGHARAQCPRRVRSFPLLTRTLWEIVDLDLVLI